MVSLFYHEYEWNCNITVVNLGFWGITFGVLKKPSVFKQRKLKFLLSHSSRWRAFHMAVPTKPWNHEDDVQGRNIL